jgi:Putative transmembrane protein (PGPGW)
MAAAIRKGCGLALIVAGLVAIPIPVIPGIPLIAAGAAMLGSDHPLVRSCRTWLRDLGIWRQERNQNKLSNVQS